jgi:hypothetical protein
LIFGGCATSSKDIAPAYVSPLQYGSYDCEQLAAEAGRIQGRAVQLGGTLDQAAQNDAGIMTVGLVLFWPILFALGGTKQQEAEYARLKGEYDAVEHAAITKKCAQVTSATQSATAAPQNPTSPNPTPPSTPTSGFVPVSASSSGDTSVVADAKPPVAELPSAAPAQPASAPAQPMAPAAQRDASVAGTSSTTGIAQGRGSKYMFTAERFAKDAGCASPVATMNIAAATYETFTVACAKGDPLSLRCDDGVCRELK